MSSKRPYILTGEGKIVLASLITAAVLVAIFAAVVALTP